MFCQAQQEQQAAKERIDTFRKMLDEAVAVENVRRLYLIQFMLSVFKRFLIYYSTYKCSRFL